MSRSGASFKLFLKRAIDCPRLPEPKFNLYPLSQRSFACISGYITSSFSMDAPNAPRSSASTTDDLTRNNRPRSELASNTKVSSWRPYRGRWNPNGISKGDHTTSAGAARARENTSTPNKQISRRGRTQYNPKVSERRIINGSIHHETQPENSYFPQSAPPPSGPYEVLNDPNLMSTLNNMAGLSTVSPGFVFSGFPNLVNTSIASGIQPSFQNMAEQQQWQFLQSPNQSALNPLHFPLLNGTVPLTGVPALLPTTNFMNFDLVNQAAASPMFNVFNPMVSNLMPPLEGILPFVPGQQSSGASQQVNIVLPERPSATNKYLEQSSLSPKVSRFPQPLLVILDLNGTLIYRKSRRLPPNFTRRAGLDHFLDTLLNNYKVMIWSSSQPATVNAVCQKLFPDHKRRRLVAEWGRDKFGLTNSQYKSKIQVYKTLETVWANKDIQASYPRRLDDIGSRKTKMRAPQPKERWDQTNTILIDDSKLKALSEPYNLIEIPEFTNTPSANEPTIFPKVLQLLDALTKYDDVSKVLKLWSSRISGNNSILDLDINAISSQPFKKGGGNATLTTTTSETPSIPSTPVDLVQARKERRKARKQEKKAARRAAAAVASTTAATTPPVSSTSTQPRMANTHPPFAANPAQQQQKRQEPSKSSQSPRKPERSPSPVTSSSSSVSSSLPSPSAQSENFLLDRLEESLNV